MSQPLPMADDMHRLKYVSVYIYLLFELDSPNCLLLCLVAIARRAFVVATVHSSTSVFTTLVHQVAPVRT